MCHLVAQRRGVYSQRNYVMIFDKEGNTALHIAVQNGNLNVSYQCYVFLASQWWFGIVVTPLVASGDVTKFAFTFHDI